jgi:hypothetical protein
LLCFKFTNELHERLEFNSIIDLDEQIDYFHCLYDNNYLFLHLNERLVEKFQMKTILDDKFERVKSDQEKLFNFEIYLNKNFELKKGKIIFL